MNKFPQPTLRPASLPAWRAGRVPACVVALVGCLWLFAARLPLHAQGPPLPELRTAEQVRRLTPEEADRHYPVKLRGTVTFFDQRTPTAAFRFIQDETAGIYFYPEASAEVARLATGQSVEIEGQTGKGEFAPIVLARRVQILGQGAFPPAKPVTFEQLISGREDSQFVEVEGIVRSARFDDRSKLFLIEMAAGGGRLTACTSELPVTRGEDLVDSTVRVRGVSYTQFNLRRQLFDIRLLLPRQADLVVEKPAPDDPFAIPAQPISSLLQFTPEGSFGHRVKVAGTVIYRQNDDALYLQDETEGLYVETKQSGPLLPGDRVEVLGFPAKGEYTPMLQDGVFRKVASGSVPLPERVSADEALKGTHDCHLVRIEAVVLDRARRSAEEFLVLEAKGFIFHAYLERKTRGTDFAHLRNGSQVAVTGVCLIEKGSGWFAGEDWRAKSFRILLRSPGDIFVLKRPPWWTLERLSWALSLLGAVSLAATAWVAILRRRVRKQTRIINQKLQAEAALKERYLELFENANDMVYTHDLQGRLTSINQAGERLLHLPREKILSRNLVDLVVPEQRAAAQQWLEQVLNGTAPPTIEWDFATGPEQRLKLEISARLIEQNGHQVEIEGIARDITERKRLERELLEISNREQRRIGHDLHDGVCQQLVGISLLAETVADQLQEKGVPESAQLERINHLLNTAIAQTRGVARGLFPVRLEENGLVSALEELATNASGLFQMACRFSCEQPPPAVDNGIALHVYYMAQEAVANAAKHGKAKNVRITLEPAADRYALTVEDDGIGFTPAGGHHTGMGLRIMHYRARVIGAALHVKSQPGCGARVTCLFVPEPRETGRKTEQEMTTK